VLTEEEARKENTRREELERKMFDDMFIDPFTIQLRKIRTYTQDKQQACQNDELVEGKTYLIVKDGKTSLGVASKAWFGWQFMANGYWHQLNHVDMVFEIEFPEFPSQPLGRVVPDEQESEGCGYSCTDCDCDCDTCDCGGCE